MFQKVISCPTSGEGDVLNLTPRLNDIVTESGISTGLCCVFVTGSTAAVTTIEYEEGVLADLKRSLTALAPSDIPYAHDAKWGDGNGRSHVKAALIGPSLTIPVSNKKMALGTWQQVILIELDTRARGDRTVIVTITG